MTLTEQVWGQRESHLLHTHWMSGFCCHFDSGDFSQFDKNAITWLHRSLLVIRLDRRGGYLSGEKKEQRGNFTCSFQFLPSITHHVF